MEGKELTGKMIRAIPFSAGILFAYFVRSTGSLHLYRITAIGGGASLGFFVGLLSIIILNLNLIIPRSFLWLMLLGYDDTRCHDRGHCHEAQGLPALRRVTGI